MPDSASSPGPSGGPLFLVGTGRCGSSITYSLLAMHKDLAWIPTWATWFPSLPQLAFANRIWDLPGTDRWREARLVPKPAEPNVLFLHWEPDFMNEVLDEDLVARSRTRLVKAVETARKWHGKPRFLSKLVGRPVKVELLAEIFRDSRFILVNRDFKPTVCSLMRVDFFEETGSLEPWPWGAIHPALLAHYEERNRPPELVAAIQVHHNLVELRRQLGRIPRSRWIEIQYRALVEDPGEQMRAITSFAGLAMDERFANRISARRVYAGADRRWEDFFDDTQLRNLEEFEELAKKAV